ncbi:tetratricopeptide repeat protein [Butyrivibrio sp. YAB3001]|uniref:tetratricopeptide repeat protein n=1 Tax=Butyrivibrio sp. YAB3001 TaxID=1520812 RepID=UPI0008F67A93|nr:tetratricopeptide repeat protein [Butyrivibrio sp. YAB3001]SFC34636.1 TPR repeat [Butyrivibrio sp. YAB3001]
MPLPILLGAAAIGAGVFGVSGHLSAKETNEAAEYKVKNAKRRYENAKQKLENERGLTETALVNLGQNKKDILDSSMTEFLKAYEKIKDVKISDSIGLDELSNMMIDEAGALRVQEISNIYTNALSSGTMGAVAGTLVGLAASGSLGLVTSTLGLAGTFLTFGEIGAAVEIAGSALAFGISATPLAAVAAPVVLFTGISASMKADDNMLEARKIEAQADAAIEKINMSIVLCNAIKERSEMFSALLLALDEKFSMCTEKLGRLIEEKCASAHSDTLSSSDFTYDEIALIAVTRALAGATKSIVDTPILTTNGQLADDAFSTYSETSCKMLEIKDTLDENSWTDEIEEEVDSLVALGDDLYFGRNGKNKDIDEAEKYYKRAADNGNQEAIKQLGNIAYDRGNHELAISYYKIGAENGYCKAEYNLAISYQFGDGVEQDYDLAIKYYTSAANHGSVGAMTNLAMIYYNGDGVEQNFETSLRWFMKAALQDDSYAQHMVGLHYFVGDGVPERDLAISKEWFSRAKANGYLDSTYFLGLIAEEQLDYELAEKYYREAIDNGGEDIQEDLERVVRLKSGYTSDYDPAIAKTQAKIFSDSMDEGQLLSMAESLFIKGQIDLAFELFLTLGEEYKNSRSMYFLGEYYIQPYGHIAQNPVKSKKCRLRGAELGDILARINVGYTYPKQSEDRQKVFKDNFDELLKLAEAGDAFAQNEIADLYFGAYEDVKDISSGIEWLRKSSEAGYWRSTQKLADHFYYGNGLPQDNGEALLYYKKAVEQGSAGAANEVGNMYYRGLGVDIDYSSAMEYYQIGCKAGYGWSMYNLANMYYNGNGTNTNYEKAIELYNLAAEHNIANAAYMIGIMYYDGKGVPADKEQEFLWFEEAAEMGHVQAQAFLGDCYYYGRGTTKDLKKARYWYQKAANGGGKGAAERLQNLFG